MGYYQEVRRQWYRKSSHIHQNWGPCPRIYPPNLEPAHYATSFDLNIVYDHIQLSENASNISTIILPWVKYRYKHLPMGVANSIEIFQQKMDYLFQGFEFIIAHMDDLLMLTKIDRKSHVKNCN